MIELPIKNSTDIYKVNPSKIIALGKNYLAHIKERHDIHVSSFTDEVPAEPILFAKTTNCLVGPDKAIVIPKIVTDYGFDEPHTHYEAELAFFIKETCKNISKEDAFKVIYGFTCMNDVSQRNIQSSDKSGWFRGKSFDTFGPIGPCVVRTEDIKDVQNLNIKCRLNGKLMQDSNTSLMLFSIDETVAFISRNFTLQAGDIITTGTPAGVGDIKHNDLVEIEIEQIGILRNTVIDEGIING